MERTLISWSWPNLITVPLMAFVGLLIAAILWQLVLRVIAANGNNSGVAQQAVGY